MIVRLLSPFLIHFLNRSNCLFKLRAKFASISELKLLVPFHLFHARIDS